MGEGLGVPRAVSLVGSECETPTNAFRVHYNPPTTLTAAAPSPHPKANWRRNPIVGLDKYEGQQQQQQKQRQPQQQHLGAQQNIVNAKETHKDHKGKEKQISQNSLKKNPDPLEPPPENLESNKDPRAPILSTREFVQSPKEPGKRPREVVQEPQKGRKKDLVLCHKFLFNPARDDSYR